MGGQGKSGSFLLYYNLVPLHFVILKRGVEGCPNHIQTFHSSSSDILYYILVLL